ncbi:hypothetical protein [Lachnoanaerobaculum saburreum]|uniref:Uncharacterized protein n=1 Tax=Lachnoanaerobaculum saburreum TaxID=467210 RepID=A0A133ZJM8_9FIRM|nr:hypothetical protein [Lachnoanaerobaculum saburreum]KXB55645.1 hypothetical protein HMPREF1866_02021 [Lachnoanaerobaculum saburreum]
MEQNEITKKIEIALNSDEKKTRNIILLGIQSLIKDKIINKCKKEKDKCIEIDIVDLCDVDLETKIVEQLNNIKFSYKKKLGIWNKLKLRFSIKTLLGALEVEKVENNDDESYGNLIKILNFFQETEYNTVIINVMDKGNIVSILGKLIAINRQINNNTVIKEKKGKIAFVYNITETTTEDITKNLKEYMDESFFFLFDYTKEMNVELLDLLFEKKDESIEYSNLLEQFFEKILNRKKESIEFIQSYLCSGEYIDLFIPKILEKSETIWEDIFFCESLQGETDKLNEYLAQILVYGNEKGIERNDKGVIVESNIYNKKCNINGKEYDIKALHNFCELYDDYQFEDIEDELEYEDIEEYDLMYDYFEKHDTDVLGKMLDEKEVYKDINENVNNFLEEVNCTRHIYKQINGDEGGEYEIDKWYWLYECFHKNYRD